MVSLNTNVQALNATRLINLNNTNLNRTTARLSSGLRINTSADDAAGLGIAEVLTSQVRGGRAAAYNIQQAASMLKAADGGLGQIADMLQRMRELAVQANNSSLSTDQATALNNEFAALSTAITNVANGTMFNGKALLNTVAGGLPAGLTAAGTVTVQTGPEEQSTSSVTFTNSYAASFATGRLASGGTALSGRSLTTQAGAAAAVTAVDAAITNVSSDRATFGAQLSGLEFLGAALDVATIQAEDARSRIQDADVATEVSNLVRQQLLQQAGASALAASNFSAQFVLKLLA